MQSFDVLDSPPATTVEKKEAGTAGLGTSVPRPSNHPRSYSQEGNWVMQSFDVLDSPPATSVEKKEAGTVGLGTSVPRPSNHPRSHSPQRFPERRNHTPAGRRR